MKAYVCERFGGPEVLTLAEVPKPVPGAHDVLIRVHATTVTSADWRIMSRTLPPGFGLIAPLVLGFRKPRNAVLGTECAGVVEAVGGSVSAFRPGDRVVAYPGGKQGAHAEYILMPDTAAIAPLPATLDFAPAAALSFGGVTALTFLETWGKLRPGEKVLVIGASGCVGSTAVQLAKYLGAEVTGVCSTANVDLVGSIGADRVIDYTRTDYRTESTRYDVILDTVGAANLRACKPVLSDAGRLLLAASGLGALVGAMVSGGRIKAGDTGESPATLRRVVEIAADGGLTPLIDQTFPFDRLPEAMTRVATHRKRGSVVVDLEAGP